jgi:ATP-dependent exoDNAse (exonuclease V) beta subunit
LPNLLHFPAPAIPPDAEARRAALDIRRSFIVEAPAGSGKTGLLIQRLLKLLADPSVEQPEQVLAITFTRKATAEMRDRVLGHLAAAAQAEAEPAVLLELAAAEAASDFRSETESLARAVLARSRQLGWALLDQPHRLNIRTIDSVCAEIARALPILSGSGGRLSPVDDAASLQREAARRTLLLLGTGDAAFDAALRNLLLHRDGNLAECESLIAQMLGLREQWGGLIPIAAEELDEAWLDANLLPRLELALDHAIRATLTPLAAAFPANLLAELTDLAAELAPAAAYDPATPSPIALCADLHNPPTALTAHLDHWLALIHLLTTGSGELRKERGINSKNIKFNYNRRSDSHTRLVALLESLAEYPHLLELFHSVRALPPARYPSDQWTVAKSLFRVLSRALVELQFVFAARNQCDYTELALLARHALATDSGSDDLASALGARLQHLLVDEMQDTSTGQYDLIQLLTRHWDAHSQTVFLVGDPRQSIYLFRQARVERFVHAMQTERLGDLPLTRLTLTANFRSQGRLVEEFNQNFGLIFPADSHLPYTPASPTFPASPQDQATHWHTNPITDDSVSSQRRDDAQAIRRIVSEWLAKPLPPGRTDPWQIAVLVRNKSHLDDIVASLKQDAIPFRAIEIESLAQRQEILDLTALARALLHPADRTAALALLRSPICGLPLVDLHILTGTDAPTLKSHSIQRLLNDRGHLLSEDSCQRLQRLWKTLVEAATQRTRLPLSQFVERAWRSLGADVFLDSEQKTNASRFFQLLDELNPQLEENSSVALFDPTLLEARLQKLFAEPASIPPGQPFVELLTIHKAKGLEWDLVLVPALERRSANDRSRLLTWSELDPLDEPVKPDDAAAHIMLAPIAGRGEASRALNNWLNSLHSAREAAERRRLFYVACTRARQELHLFAAPPVSTSGEVAPPHASLLQAAWPAAQPHFAAPLPDEQETGERSSAPFIAPLSHAMSGPSDTELILDLAASASPTLLRLPLSFDPTARIVSARARRLPYGEADLAPISFHSHLSRPEGSFAARAFGNVVHAALESFAARIATGSSAATLLAELPNWLPRLSALLRADGLPQPTVSRLAREALAALTSTLSDPNGLWLLSPHASAASEFALTAWPAPFPEEDSRPVSIRPTSIRIDRLFQAGAKPHIPGEDTLWIVDYKTTAPHSSASLDEFLTAQRSTYAPQLETYARVLTQSHPTPKEVRLALYYPTLPHLLWWPLTDSLAQSALA